MSLCKQRCNKSQQNAHSLHYSFNLIIVSSACFDHPIVYLQEDLYMQFFYISLMLPYKQSGRWQDVIYVRSVHFVGSYYIGILQCTVQQNVQ
jgi:hypothetical protein